MPNKTTTEWRPTAKQQAVLNVASEAGINRSITKVCSEANVTRKTFYGWLETDPHFKEVWENVWRGAIKKHLPGVVMAQIKQALDGDTRAAEFVAKLAGVLNENIKHDFPTDFIINLRRNA